MDFGPYIVKKKWPPLFSSISPCALYASEAFIGRFAEDRVRTAPHLACSIPPGGNYISYLAGLF